MKNFRMRKMKTGGYLSGLEKYPDLQKTIQNYRDRLKSDQDLLQKFDKTAQSQMQATANMPAAERSAYIADIQKQYAKPSDEQFAAIKADLQSDKRIKPTYRYPIYTTSYGPTQGYYRNLSKEIGEKQKEMEGLTVTETSKRMVPQYEMSYAQPMYGPAKPSKIVSELPKGARLTQGNYGAQYYQVPSSDPFFKPATGPRYRRVGSKEVTDTTTRAAKAGDPIYDEAQRELARLQKRHDYRNIYSSGQQNQLTDQNIYSSLGITSPSPQQTRRSPRGPQTAFASFIKPRTLNKGGEIQGKGKAVRGFKFGGIK